MPHCHLCNSDTGLIRRIPTDFECPHCYLKPVDYMCKRCACWYFSTHLNLVELPDTLKSRDDRSDPGAWVTPCRATLKPREDEYAGAHITIDQLSCKTIAYQKPNIFDQYLSSVVLWKRLFVPKSNAAMEDNRRRQFMETLVLVFWSSRHLVKKRYTGGSQSVVHPWMDHFDYLHTHDIPKIAAKHLECCFSGPYRLPPGTLDLGKAVLGQSIIERYLKGKINLGLAGKLFNEINIASTGGLGYPNENPQQTLMHLAAQLFQVTFPYLEKDPAVDRFFPRNGVAYNTDGMMKRLFDDDHCFSKLAKSNLGALYRRLRTGSHARPIFENAPLAVPVAPGLNRAVDLFFKMLPTMDHRTGDASITPCERRVRDKVKTQIKKLFTADDPPQTLDDKYFAAFPNLCQRFLGATATNKTVTGEGPWDRLLDGIVAALNSDLFWLEISFGQSLTSHMLQQVRAGQWADFRYVSDYELNKKEVQFKADLLNLCNPVGGFWGVNYAKAYRETKQDGRDENDIYWDWRVDKDFALYEGFIPTMGLEPGYAGLMGVGLDSDAWLGCLPVFASLSPVLSCPLPNFKQYGHNTMVLDPASVRNRCVFTLSDTAPARRSRLLLLYDTLYDIPPKSEMPYYDETLSLEERRNSEYIKKASYVIHNRVRRFLAILSRVEKLNTNPPPGPNLEVTALRNNWQTYLSDARTAQGEPIGTPLEEWVPHTAYFECHIFGDLKPAAHTKAFLLCETDNQAETLEMEAQLNHLFATSPNGNAVVCYKFNYPYMTSADQDKLNDLKERSDQQRERLIPQFYVFKS